MKYDQRNMAIFRGLHFAPDNEIGPKNFFEMACSPYLGKPQH